MTFYLGTHRPHWLETVPVPFCVSRRSLVDRRTLPRACRPWMLDSGGFTELSLSGEWRLSPARYAAEARRFQTEIGSLAAAGIQDWMCEEGMREQTGLSVAAHQERTLKSFQRLSDLAPAVPWLPTLQGWERDDYLRHWEAYEHAGIRLEGRLVGVGTLCRRQHTAPALEILFALQPLALHAFGFKRQGLKSAAHLLHAADSFAWSFRARRAAPLPGCTTHKNCANCLRFALKWRQETLLGIAGHEEPPCQLSLSLLS